MNTPITPAAAAVVADFRHGDSVVTVRATGDGGATIVHDDGPCTRVDADGTVRPAPPSTAVAQADHLRSVLIVAFRHLGAFEVLHIVADAQRQVAAECRATPEVSA